MSGHLEITELDTLPALEALRPEWRGLWERIFDSTPFQSPDWLIPWWRFLGRGKLCVLVLRRDGQLVGLVPLTVSEGTRPDRKLALMGSGVSDYLDALLEPEIRSRGAALSLSRLERLAAKWDLCELAQLRPQSALFEAAAPKSCIGAIVLEEPCPVLQLTHPEGGLDQVIPAHQAANVKYYRMRAHRRGVVTVESAAPSNLESLLAEFFRLHKARWSQAGSAGVLDHPAVAKFHREVASGMLASGILRLNVVYLDQHAIGVYYGFTHRRRAYYYLGGFDPEFGELSPGTLAIAHAIEQALGEGVEAFDFLRGREPYKYLWGARDEITCRRTFARRTRTIRSRGEYRSAALR